MTEKKNLLWEIDKSQNYEETLKRRRSERRYRALQLVKTLKILSTKELSMPFKEIHDWIEKLEIDSEYLTDEDFSAAKKYVTKLQKEYEKSQS
ncbi:MAG: hypothetical protein LBI13_03820 [Streptococcaceae bacterium]|jgi:hypothetical protein|nr:hypothetical protein [Streptococcaceae bacterium]